MYFKSRQGLPLMSNCKRASEHFYQLKQRGTKGRGRWMEKKDLSLVRLEAIDEGWDGALGVHVGEGLLVDKVVVYDGLGACAVQVVLGQSQLGM